ncbi:hypothetical protein DYQ86_19430 [Acidobacteria bacterium AB60]|nr:hypothetical protein DYQ86_19430 [Acidobacteria bacterium AB60]
METDLRPLSLGEILDRTAQLYRTNFGLFAGIFAITNGMVLVLVVLFEGLSADYRSIQTTMKLQWGPVLGFVLLLSLASMLLYGASIAAITRAVGWVHVGEPATIRNAYASTLPRLGRYLWLMTLAALVLLGVALLSALVLGIALVVVTAGLSIALGGSKQAVGIVGILVGLFLDVAVFAVVCWFATRYALGIPACVVENLKARKALRRSVELSKGARGRIFLLFLLVGVLQVGLLVLTQSPFYVYLFRHHLQLSLALSILSQIISIATDTLVGPILATGITLFYFDQRVRKEGYDIEWMMAAAGMAGAAPAGAGQEPKQTVAAGTAESAPELPPAPDALSPGDGI